MSRKSKVGLDYFPHNCSYDDELKYIIAKHQELGYYIYFETLKRIYNEFGYYMKSSTKSLVLHSGEINVDINLLNVVINDCLSEHLFDKNIHKKYDILTSKGIQERYFEAIKRRNSVGIIKEYILTDYANILGDNVNINLLKVDTSTQSKVKKSKVNKSKEKPDFIDKIIDVFKQKYLEFRDLEYFINGKDRSAVGNLLKIYKNKDSDSEQTIKDFELFFDQCLRIQDKWYWNNMSLSIINSKINEIRNILRKDNVTSKEIRNAIDRNF